MKGRISVQFVSTQDHTVMWHDHFYRHILPRLPCLYWLTKIYRSLYSSCLRPFTRAVKTERRTLRMLQAWHSRISADYPWVTCEQNTGVECHRCHHCRSKNVIRRHGLCRLCLHLSYVNKTWRWNVANLNAAPLKMSPMPVNLYADRQVKKPDDVTHGM